MSSYVYHILNCSHPVFPLYPPSWFPPPSFASNLGSASGNELYPVTDDQEHDDGFDQIPALLSPTRMIGSEELKTTVLGIALEADTTNCL